MGVNSVACNCIVIRLQLFERILDATDPQHCVANADEETRDWSRELQTPIVLALLTLSCFAHRCTIASGNLIQTYGASSCSFLSASFPRCDEFLSLSSPGERKGVLDAVVLDVAPDCLDAHASSGSKMTFLSLCHECLEKEALDSVVPRETESSIIWATLSVACQLDAARATRHAIIGKPQASGTDNSHPPTASSPSQGTGTPPQGCGTGRVRQLYEHRLRSGTLQRRPRCDTCRL